MTHPSPVISNKHTHQCRPPSFLPSSQSQKILTCGNHLSVFLDSLSSLHPYTSTFIFLGTKEYFFSNTFEIFFFFFSKPWLHPPKLLPFQFTLSISLFLLFVIFFLLSNTRTQRHRHTPIWNSYQQLYKWNTPISNTDTFTERLMDPSTHTHSLVK